MDDDHEHQRLPSFKDQVRFTSGSNNRPLNVATRTATTNDDRTRRRVAVDAPPSVDHNQQQQQPPQRERLPTYKDQITDGDGNVNSSNSAVAIPIISDFTRTNGEQRQLSPQRDLVEYKDQVRSQEPRFNSNGNSINTNVEVAAGFDGPYDPDILPQYKDQAQTIVAPVGATGTIEDSTAALNTYPLSKDQIYGDDDVDHPIDALSPKKPSVSHLRQMQISPQRQPERSIEYKDQIHSRTIVTGAVQVPPENTEELAGSGRENVSVRKKKSPAIIQSRIATQQGQQRPPPERLPGYKEQAQSIVIQSPSVVIDVDDNVTSGGYLPQYKDQVIDESTRGRNSLPTNTGQPSISQQLQGNLPEYKDQSRPMVVQASVTGAQNLPNIPSQLSNYKDQIHGEPNRKSSSSTLPVASNSANSVPNDNDQILSEEDRQHQPLTTKSTIGNSATPESPFIPSCQHDESWQQHVDTNETSPTTEHERESSSPTTNGENVELQEMSVHTIAIAAPYQEIPVYPASDPIVPQGGVLYAEGVGILVDVEFDDAEPSGEVEEESPDDTSVASILADKDQKSKRRGISILVISGIFILIAGIIVGGVCGSGACTRSISNSPNDNSSASPMTPNVEYPIPFLTTEELYNAVNEYIDAFYGNTTRETNVLTIYGPIAEWDVSQLTNLALVFYGGDRNAWPVTGSDLSLTQVPPTAFNEDISSWNISSATTLEGMFAGAVDFTGVDLSRWDTSRVTSMRGMFHSASSFNGNLGNWNVQSVTDFSGMFLGCTEFQGNGLELWNIESAQDLSGTFLRATNFATDLSMWNTKNVKSLQRTFQSSSRFKGTGLGLWNVSAVTSLASTFLNAIVFNDDLSSWETGQVTDLSQTFENATLFNSDLPWDVSAVTTMRSTFFEADSFNGDISLWDTSKCTDMSFMLSGITIFTGDVSLWDTNQVTTMANMFEGSGFFDSDVSNWNVSQVQSMSNMFRLASRFNRDISGWDVRQVTFMDGMFQGATAFTQNLCNWGVQLQQQQQQQQEDGNNNGLLLNNIFTEAQSCASTESPNISNIIAGPWCSICTTSTT